MRHLLNHRCDVVQDGTAAGEDDYGRPIHEASVIEGVPCLFMDDLSSWVKDENGADVILVGRLILPPEVSVRAGNIVTNIKTKEGTSVREGTLVVVGSKLARTATRFSHWECQLAEVGR